MMKQSDTKRSSFLSTYITYCADPDDSDGIADDTEDDSCVTWKKMHTFH
jgi:hypothetical protein